MSKNWSSQQIEIFNWAKEGDGNLVVRARAGAGKTTTILQAVDHAREPSKLLAAFNKRIANELSSRITTPGAQAKTLHGLGFALVRKFWRNVQLDNRRGEKLAAMAIGPEAPDEAVKLVGKVASIGKAIGDFSPELLARTAVAMDKEPSEEMEDLGFDLERVCAAASLAMRMSMRAADDDEKQNPVIDFDDMVWLPIANKWVYPQFGIVFIDEAQDMNPAQLSLAMQLARHRVCVVGDDRQAIYGFRGAKQNAIDWMKSELNAKEVGLSTTYRCGKRIVAAAAELVPDFRAGETNPEGSLANITRAEMMVLADPGDFVLSRTNAPLAEICLGFLRAGKRARIEGKNIGATLARIIRERNARTIDDLSTKLAKWAERQINKIKGTAKLTNDEKTSKIGSINDAVETIEELADGLAIVPELLARIESLFSDTDDNPPPSIVCSTIHKAKGLETDNVFILQWTLYPGGDRTRIEEKNLEYVAITRAKKVLARVSDLNAAQVKS